MVTPPVVLDTQATSPTAYGVVPFQAFTGATSPVVTKPVCGLMTTQRLLKSCQLENVVGLLGS